MIKEMSVSGGRIHVYTQFYSHFFLTWIIAKGLKMHIKTNDAVFEDKPNIKDHHMKILPF